MQTSIKRCWNLSLWAGFLLVVAGVLSYIPIFALFPITRDFPWANLLLFLAVGVFLGPALLRPSQDAGIHLCQIFRSILTPPPLALVGFVLFRVFSHIIPVAPS